jgi:Zn finger protein HypA/HybF involved in hydrogenase expression
MGEGITIKCKRCDYQDSFLLGVGMMYSSLLNVISQVSPHRRDKVLNILATRVIHEVSYKHRLFVCPKCNNLAGRFDFSILYGDNQIYRPYFRCSKCRTNLLTLNAPITTLSCPQCGKKSLITNGWMLWD